MKPSEKRRLYSTCTMRGFSAVLHWSVSGSENMQEKAAVVGAVYLTLIVQAGEAVMQYTPVRARKDDMQDGKLALNQVFIGII